MIDLKIPMHGLSQANRLVNTDNVLYTFCWEAGEREFCLSLASNLLSAASTQYILRMRSTPTSLM